MRVKWRGDDEYRIALQHASSLAGHRFLTTIDGLMNELM